MTERDIAERMQAAALRFLDSLDDNQRSVAQCPFEDTDERQTWFYTPTDHGGLPLSAMRPAQQKLAHMLLAEGLSEPGYNTTAAIIGLDNMLDRLEGFQRDWGRERGRDPGLYYWRIFGNPESSDPWSWRVGGHHVSIHHTIVDGVVVASTPLFLGADPASAPLLGPQPHRPLGAVEDRAHALMATLSDEQRGSALVCDVAPTDIVGGNRPLLTEGAAPMPLPDLWRGRLPDPLHDLTVQIQSAADEFAGISDQHVDAVRWSRQPKGVCAADLDSGQRDVLRSLLDLYALRLPGPLAEIERDKYADARLNDHFLLWAGSEIPGDPYYYRIQGPRLIVECDNTQRGANHIHTVWRDPDRDFGRDLLAEHYRSSEH